MFEICPICHFDSVICAPRAGHLYDSSTVFYASWDIPFPDLEREYFGGDDNA